MGENLCIALIIEIVHRISIEKLNVVLLFFFQVVNSFQMSSSFQEISYRVGISTS